MINMIKQRLRCIESFLKTPHARTQPRPRPLKTVQDVLDLLEEQVAAVRAAPWAEPIEKARAIASLAGVARRVIEDSVLADRIEMLEAVLGQRKDPKP